MNRTQNMQKKKQKSPMPMRCWLIFVIQIGIILSILLLFLACYWMQWAECLRTCYHERIFKFFTDFTDLFLNADTSGYDAAAAVIAAIGLGGFAISNISTFSIRRSHGIMHYYLLKFYFPTYSTIFVLHILFVLIGLYACEQGNIAWIACSLIGVSYSLLYSISILLATEHGGLLNKILINFFVWCARRRGCAGLIANDVAVHISNSFQNSSTRSGKKINAGDTFDLKILIKLLNMNKNDPDAKPWSLHHDKAGNIRASDQWKWENLYTMPVIMQKREKRKGKRKGDLIYRGTELSDQIQRCCAMWEICEQESANAGNKIERTAAEILSYALTKNEQTAFALMCGLLLHLRLSQITDTDDESNHWKDCCSFLNRLLNSAQGTQKDIGQALRKHMALLSLSLLCWEQFVLAREPLTEPVLKDMATALGRQAGSQIDAVDLWAPLALNIYTVCAFFVCKAYNTKDCYPFTRQHIEFCYQHLMPQLELLSRHCIS